MADDTHSGRRARMRERFLNTDPAGFQPHEVLEMLLYYGIPRKDTAPVANALLDQFGSLHGVLSAEPEQLQKVPGMTGNAAMMLAYLRAVYVYDFLEQSAGMCMDSFQTVCGFFVSLYRYEAKETVYAAMLDAQLHLKACAAVAEGHPDASAAQVLTELAQKTGCNHLILAHSHPSGSTDASPEDLSVTRCLAEKLKLSGLHLVDHIIVSGNRAGSMLEQGAFFGSVV